MNQIEDFNPAFDRGRFRCAVARFVRLLVRARRMQEPRFFSAADLATWQISQREPEPHVTARLLELAAGALGHLNVDFIPRCGAGGIPCLGEETPLDRLVLNVADLVSPQGGGPAHNLAPTHLGTPF